MADTQKLPKGYTCKCGTFNEYPFSPYVYAHMRAVLLHTCECGRKYSIIMATAKLVEEDV
jgi:hypothetical protein